MSGSYAYVRPQAVEADWLDPPLTPPRRTTAMTLATAAGTVAAGKRSITFQNVHASAASTVKGVSLAAGKSVTFTAPPGETLDAVAYDATSSSLLISSVA